MTDNTFARTIPIARFDGRQILPWRRECGLGTITFHQATRKTGATRILDAGGSLADAQLSLGHKDIRTTIRYLNVGSGTARAAKNAAADWYEEQRAAASQPRKEKA